MRKKLVLITFFSISIICSLSFQPMLADEPLKTNPVINDLNKSDRNIDFLMEPYIRFYNEKFQSNEDCNCRNNDIKKFLCDIIETILGAFYFFIEMLQRFIAIFNPDIAGLLDIIDFFLPFIFILPLYIIFDCGPIGPPQLVNLLVK